VLEPTKAAVLDRYHQLRGQVDNVAPVLENTAGQRFYCDDETVAVAVQV